MVLKGVHTADRVYNDPGPTNIGCVYVRVPMFGASLLTVRPLSARRVLPLLPSSRCSEDELRKEKNDVYVRCR